MPSELSVRRILKPLLFWPVAALVTACVGGEDTAGFTEPGAPPPPPPMSVTVVGDDTVTEGSLAAALSWSIELSEPTDSDVVVSYTTRSASAIAGDDFIARSGDVTIAAGQQTAAFDVTIIDDNIDEPDEILFVDARLRVLALSFRQA